MYAAGGVGGASTNRAGLRSACVFSSGLRGQGNRSRASWLAVFGWVGGEGALLIVCAKYGPSRPCMALAATSLLCLQALANSWLVQVRVAGQEARPAHRVPGIQGGISSLTWQQRRRQQRRLGPLGGGARGGGCEERSLGLRPRGRQGAGSIPDPGASPCNSKYVHRQGLRQACGTWKEDSREGRQGLVLGPKGLGRPSTPWVQARGGLTCTATLRPQPKVLKGTR
jgi:hypothetical protein